MLAKKLLFCVLYLILRLGELASMTQIAAIENV